MQNSLTHTVRESERKPSLFFLWLRLHRFKRERHQVTLLWFEDTLLNCFSYPENKSSHRVEVPSFSVPQVQQILRRINISFAFKHKRQTQSQRKMICCLCLLWVKSDHPLSFIWPNTETHLLSLPMISAWVGGEEESTTELKINSHSSFIMQICG